MKPEHAVLLASVLMEGGICRCGHAALTHSPWPFGCDCCRCWRFKTSKKRTDEFIRQMTRTDEEIEAQFKAEVDKAVNELQKTMGGHT